MSYTRPTIGAGGIVGCPMIPAANYRVLCTEVTYKVSSNQNAMSVCSVQILSPESVLDERSGQTADTAGKEGKMNVTYSEKNMKNVIDVFAKLGVPLPPQATSFEEDIQLLHAALKQHIETHTFEMVVSSKRRPMAVNGVEMKDSLGNAIVGSEQADFAMFNVVGLVKSLEQLGAVAPQRF